jgi:hypothetical protein
VGRTTRLKPRRRTCQAARFAQAPTAGMAEPGTNEMCRADTRRTNLPMRGRDITVRPWQRITRDSFTALREDYCEYHFARGDD